MVLLDLSPNEIKKYIFFSCSMQCFQLYIHIQCIHSVSSLYNFCTLLEYKLKNEGITLLLLRFYLVILPISALMEVCRTIIFKLNFSLFSVSH